MAKPGKNNIMKTQKSPKKIQHMFRQVREPLMVDTATRQLYAVSSDAQGAYSTQLTLSPLGLRSVRLNGTIFSDFQLERPHLLFLGTQSSNFEMYRISNTKLIFVGNAGTNIQGTLNMLGVQDPMDTNPGINTAFMVGPGAKSYDLSSAGSKELALNFPCDSSWKKVTARLAVPSNVQPFGYTDATGFASVNSVSDVSFGAVAFQAINAPPNTNLGNVFLQYDVEFKNPISIGLNI